MQYRKFGKKKRDISILGFGCMRLPIADGKIDRDTATKMLDYAIDKGVNYLDTAYTYHGGESELFVGEYLKDKDRSKIFLATKLPSWLIHKREDMDHYLNDQLKKLQTDHIDYYLLHSLNKDYWKTYKENGVFEFIEKAKAKGKIGEIGFSFHDEHDVFLQIIDDYDGWDFCQIQMNYLDEEVQAGLKGQKYAMEKGIDVVIMEPLRGGSLTASVPNDIQLIWDKAAKKRTPAEWALNYLWQYEEIKVVLSGMSALNHVIDNTKYACDFSEVLLTDEDRKLIVAAKEQYKARTKVPCTSCEYCLPCPAGVKINECFSAINYAFMFDAVESASRGYNGLGDGKASKCVECGECLSKCPQHIAIPDMLKEVVTVFGD